MAGFNLSSVGFMGGITGLALPAAAAGYDSDAQAFISAASLTVAAQMNAVNQLVLDLKAAGAWTLLAAAYPIVGGNGPAHAYNLKNPQATAAAYYLTYTGTPVHSSTGIVWGAGQYANTNVSIAHHDVSIGYYLQTAATAADVVMGSYGGSGDLYLQSKSGGNTSVFTADGGNYAQGPVVAAGLLHASAKAQVTLLYNRATQTATGIQNATTTLTGPLFLGGANNGGALGLGTNAACSFAYVGLGMTAAQLVALANAVQNYQVALGRAV